MSATVHENQLDRVAPVHPPTNWPRFMGVRQVADYLGLNEKKVYALVAEGKLPATKLTGKWLFPRELVDQWILETSHGGILTDRLVLVGSDDPLLDRAVTQLATEVDGAAVVAYTSTGTRLGLSLLARHRADISAIHWGPLQESEHRHPGLIQPHPQHRDWVIVRLFAREQGLIVAPRLGDSVRDLTSALEAKLRWSLRQPGAGSRRFLQESLAEIQADESELESVRLSRSEREAAAHVAMGLADIAPGVRASAGEFGLGFIHLGWEGFDLVMSRAVYFRRLLQRLLNQLRTSESDEEARDLGGYDFSEHGRLVWAA